MKGINKHLPFSIFIIIKHKGSKIMSKRNLSKILIILIVTLIILAGILLYFFVFSKKSLEPIIEIKSEDEIHKTLSIKALNLSPGENKKYTIKILNRSGSDYNFSLEFVQKGEGRLYNFIDVEMSMGDKTVKRSLKDLFEGGDVKFEKKIERNYYSIFCRRRWK